MAATPTRHACPVCDFELEPGVEKCPNCTTDLRLFAASPDMALDFYNDGLDLARAGDRSGALEKMRGALAADPKMVDAYIVAGKLLAQSGKTADLEQAIAYWEKARGLRPTGDQNRKLDNCIETADASLRRLERQGHARRRNAVVGLVVGGLVFAAACGVGGYLLRPPHHTQITVYQPVPIVKKADDPETPPDNPVEAINRALNRPGIKVMKTGNTLRLAGKVASDSEKQVTIAAAAFAAKVPESQIDATDLKVKPIFRSVGSRRVEHMLNLFIGGLSHNRTDPLYGARLTVTGGVEKEPLKVSGTCLSSRAGPEIISLVKEVYPSANAVDVSGLKTAPVRRGVRHIALLDRPVVKPHKAWTRKSSADSVRSLTAGSSYTVQPGDSIFQITHKYGHGSADWHTLYEANRKTIKNPNSIPAGTVLKLPSGWRNSDKTEGGAP